MSMETYFYGTDSKIEHNRFLNGWDHSGIQAGFSGSEYKEGTAIMGDNNMKLIWIFATPHVPMPPSLGLSLLLAGARKF